MGTQTQTITSRHRSTCPYGLGPTLRLKPSCIRERGTPPLSGSSLASFPCRRPSQTELPSVLAPLFFIPRAAAGRAAAGATRLLASCPYHGSQGKRVEKDAAKDRRAGECVLLKGRGWGGVCLLKMGRRLGLLCWFALRTWVCRLVSSVGRHGYTFLIMFFCVFCGTEKAATREAGAEKEGDG